VICGEHTLFAENVVVATGAYNNPGSRRSRASSTRASSSSTRRKYRNPSQIQEGGVLVVGAGNSGAEIAIELAPHHQTWLSGRDTGQEPTRAGSLPDQPVHAHHVVDGDAVDGEDAIGRKLRDHFLDPPRESLWAGATEGLCTTQASKECRE
jgi:putative flavoprotein involved in K+ transport